MHIKGYPAANSEVPAATMKKGPPKGPSYETHSNSNDTTQQQNDRKTRKQ